MNGGRESARFTKKGGEGKKKRDQLPLFVREGQQAKQRSHAHATTQDCALQLRVL